MLSSGAYLGDQNIIISSDAYSCYQNIISPEQLYILRKCYIFRIE